MPIGVIGGTGMGSWQDAARARTVTTPHGDVHVETVDIDGIEVVALDRHRGGVPAHAVPHKAHLSALRTLGVDALLAVNNVGSLRATVRPGDLVVPDDLFDRSTQDTMIDDGIVHVAMDPPFCPHLRAAWMDAFDGREAPVHGTGTYVQSRGPRLETRAEARFLSGIGHIVGMTAGPEAVLAREAGVCYGAVCFVANQAPGIGDVQMTAPQIRDALAARRDALAEGVRRAVAAVPSERACICRSAPDEGRLS